jgi:hypothetical protein
MEKCRDFFFFLYAVRFIFPDNFGNSLINFPFADEFLHSLSLEVVFSDYAERLLHGVFKDAWNGPNSHSALVIWAWVFSQPDTKPAHLEPPIPLGEMQSTVQGYIEALGFLGTRKR